MIKLVKFLLLTSLIAGCVSGKPTVPVGTHFTTPGEVTVWYAPGGKSSAQGDSKEKVADLRAGTELTVCADHERGNRSEAFQIGDGSPWERVCYLNNGFQEIGWVYLPNLQNPGQ